MIRPVHLLLAMLFCLLTATAALAADAAETAAITAAVKAYVTRETVESVYVEKLAPPFAAAIVSVQNGDGGTAYLMQRDGSWTVILYSAAPTEDALIKNGMPADTAKKLLE